jgi:PadR family transcriptional regulator, regulatory protein PadR
MPKHANDRLQGTLDLVVLKTLQARGAMHGYAIANLILQISSSVLRVEEGSLYPALHRMTQAGWLRAEWGASENGRRARYYSVTPAGRRQLAEEEKNWAALTGAVSQVLRLV